MSHHPPHSFYSEIVQKKEYEYIVIVLVISFVNFFICLVKVFLMHSFLNHFSDLIVILILNFFISNSVAKLDIKRPSNWTNSSRLIKSIWSDNNHWNYILFQRNSQMKWPFFERKNIYLSSFWILSSSSSFWENTSAHFFVFW